MFLQSRTCPQIIVWAATCLILLFLANSTHVGELAPGHLLQAAFLGLQAGLRPLCSRMALGDACDLSSEHSDRVVIAVPLSVGTVPVSISGPIFPSWLLCPGPMSLSADPWGVVSQVACQTLQVGAGSSITLSPLSWQWPPMEAPAC